jgi:predicted RNA-binding protein
VVALAVHEALVAVVVQAVVVVETDRIKTVGLALLVKAEMVELEAARLFTLVAVVVVPAL